MNSLSVTFLNEPELICFPNVKWFQSWLSNTILFNSNNTLEKLNCSIRIIDRTLTGTIILGSNEPESNGYEEVLHIP